jgi:hypothetical protein
VIVDPIDGTRGIMYDKRAAWALAGVAPNKGPGTRLRDIEVAVMTELPTSKMGLGRRAVGREGARHAGGARRPRGGGASELRLRAVGGRPGSTTASRRSATSSPGTKVLASELMEHLAGHSWVRPT